jgi:type VI secretion system secreted protein Hcp
MALELFLKLDGIDGESQKDGHEKEIDIFSVSLAANNTSTVGAGTGSGSGKVDISALNISKATDASSPLLFQKCCDGSHIATGKVTFREVGGSGGPVEYLTYDLTECFISSCTASGSDGSGRPMESISLTFTTITINYTPQTAEGTPGDKIPASWDIGKGKAAGA